MTLHATLANRFDSILKDKSISWISEAVLDHFDGVLNQELTHVMVQRGDMLHVFYVEPWKVKWLFDAYST